MSELAWNARPIRSFFAANADSAEVPPDDAIGADGAPSPGVRAEPVSAEGRLRRLDEAAEREHRPPCKGSTSRIRHESRYDMQGADQGNQREIDRNNEYPAR